MDHPEEKHLVIRVDASTQIGTGHLMRCLAFAQGLGNIGVNSIFVIRNYEPRVAEIIRHYKYGVELTPKSRSFKEDLSLTYN